MDLPPKFRSKYGVSDIQIDGVNIKATLVDPYNSSLLETLISEFKSHVETDLPVVGVDFKPHDWKPLPSLLLLYTKDHCLVIQLSLIRRFPNCLGSFLSDSSICFVGLKIDEVFDRIRSDASRRSYYGPYDSGLTGKGAEIRRLATGVVKNPVLVLDECCDVFELATKSGLVDMKMPDETRKPSDWGATVFSEGEMEYAVHDAYYCYQMGKKLLSMLDLDPSTFG